MSKCKEKAETNVWETDTKILASKSFFVKQEMLHRNSSCVETASIESYKTAVVFKGNKGKFSPMLWIDSEIISKRGTPEVTVFTEQPNCLGQ